MATSADVSTPAARASALNAPRPPAPEDPAGGDDEPDGPRRRPLRTVAMLTALLVILAGGLFAGWTYTQRQYYVGATEQGQLAVFRGVPGQVAGLDLSDVHSESPARLDDLTLAAQEQVKQGIQAKSEPDAERRLAELTSDDPANPNLKPICPPAPTAVASGSPLTPTPAPSVSAAGRPANPSATPAPTSTPDASVSDAVPPVLDPAGCRSPE